MNGSPTCARRIANYRLKTDVCIDLFLPATSPILLCHERSVHTPAHILTTIATLLGPGGARAVVANSLLMKQQQQASIQRWLWKTQTQVQPQEKWQTFRGQSGHKGHTLEQVDEPDEIIEHTVDHCGPCGLDLSSTLVSDYEKRQVFDILPPPRIQVSEHRAQIKTGPCCQNRNKALFPAQVSRPVQYGNRVQAIATYLNQYQLLLTNDCKSISRTCMDCT